MDVKTYKAGTIQEAVRKIKEELGCDAMILSTRRIPHGACNPCENDAFEITAASSLPSPDSGRDHPPHDDIALARAGISASGSTGTLDVDHRWNTIAEELVSIKDMLFVLNCGSKIPDMLDGHPECLKLYALLMKTGMSDRSVHRLMKSSGILTGPMPGQPPDDLKSIRNRVFTELLSIISPLDPFETEGRCISAFIGPTGVGKTTTIAKLAAELSLKRKKRVGIISIDNYRIGAFDQIHTYAAIMGISCQPAFSKKDLETAIEKMQGADVILIDTAGQSHLDRGRIEELGDIMNDIPAIRRHLVLSVTANLQNMREAAENFSVLKPCSYIFTKLDETRQRGGIIEQVLNLNMPVSFFTNGQRVPEDIIQACRNSILSTLLSPFQGERGPGL